ncbi:cAMP-dependent protein kinase catalytic subunit gamma-like [Liolophura sinensis]|uniref:cAMP-dependent protein kinase catalytic subunit gamma-like n=1 Tax=Liolophura sinensis TaxID=3198878 RepID=UPI00315871FB
MPRRFQRLRNFSQRIVIITRTFVTRWYCGFCYPSTVNLPQPEDVHLPSESTLRRLEISESCESLSKLLIAHTSNRQVTTITRSPTSLSHSRDSVHDLLIHGGHICEPEHLCKEDIQESHVVQEASQIVETLDIVEDTVQKWDIAQKHMQTLAMVEEVRDLNVLDTRSSCSVNTDCVNVLPYFTPVYDLQVEHAKSTCWESTQPHHWHILKPLSWGGFGIVNLARLQETGKMFVVKTYKPQYRPGEMVILKECQGQFVVSLYASLVSTSCRFVCMEYCRQGSLRQLIQCGEHQETFPEPVAAMIVAYIYAGVSFLHEKEILHLDISLENILITIKGYPVLTGFANACHFNEDVPSRERLNVLYASPEILENNPPNNLADLWSVACILYELIVGKTPFHSSDLVEARLRVTLGLCPDFSELSTEAGNFLSAELSLTADKRPGFQCGIAGIMKREVFRTVSWKHIRKGNRKGKCPLQPIWKAVRANLRKFQVEDDDNEEQHAEVLEKPSEKFDCRLKRIFRGS